AAAVWTLVGRRGRYTARCLRGDSGHPIRGRRLLPCGGGATVVRFGPPSKRYVRGVHGNLTTSARRQRRRLSFVSPIRCPLIDGCTGEILAARSQPAATRGVSFALHEACGGGVDLDYFHDAIPSN